MNKQTRRLIMLSAALVLAVLLAWALLRPDSQMPAVEKETAAPERSVLAGEVVQVHIQRSDENYAMDVRGVEGLPAEITDSARVAGTLSALSSLTLTPLEGEASPAGAYGFDADATRVEVRFADGGGYVLEVGAKEPVSSRRYCRIEGEDTLFLMDGALGEWLAGSRESYLSMQITPVCRSKSALSAVKDFMWESGAEQIRIESCDCFDDKGALELLSFGAVTHVIYGPGLLHEVDRTYADKVFSSLFDLKALEIIAYGLSPEEVRARGFDQPDLQLRIGVKNGDAPETEEERWMLRILWEDDGTALATMNDAGTIYRIADAPFLHAKYEDFVCRWFLSPLMMDLFGLRISTSDGEHAYEIQGDASDMRVTSGGRELDLARFRSFYTLVVSAASNGDAAPESDLVQNAVLRIEFLYRNGNKSPDVLEFRELDARRLCVSVNGVTEFAMRSSYLDALNEAMTALEGDGEIPQTW